MYDPRSDSRGLWRGEVCRFGVVGAEVGYCYLEDCLIGRILNF